MTDTNGLTGTVGVPEWAVALSLVLVLAGWVLFSIALAKIFQKLGDDGWKAWVPVVNTITIYRLGGVSPLWVIALFVPVVNVVAVVFFYLAVHEINTRLGRGAGMTVLAIFFTVIWALVLGFGSARVVGGNPPIAPNDHRAPRAEWADSAHQAFPAQPAESANSVESVEPADARPAAPGLIDRVPGIPTAAVPVHATQASTAPVAATPEWGASAPATPLTPSRLPASGIDEPVVSFWGPTAPVAPPEPNGPRSFDSPAHLDAPLDDATIITGTREPETDHDETVIVNRLVRQPWTLETAQGQTVRLTSDVVLLGRSPVADPKHPTAQLVAVRDTGKTVSKLHARISFDDDGWTITDLNSTNGVIVQDADGIETELAPGSTFVVRERFLLGELATRIYLT